MLADLIPQLQQSLNILQKRDIQTAAQALRSPTFEQVFGSDSTAAILNGDDCAAIPNGDRYLLLAAEGISPEFLARDPWFAGWCAVTVNISDVAAMGGRPLAVVDALWSGENDTEVTQAIWAGMTAAAAAYQVPVVGGHTNSHSPYLALAAAILGQANQLITSFDAQPGDVLLVATDMRGEFYQDYPFWNAATEADPERLRADLQLLPLIAESNLCQAGKDISMGGIVGTLLMLMETSGVGAVLNVEAIAKPAGVSWLKWLTCFPSFGYLLSVKPHQARAVIELFESRDIACSQVGEVTEEPQVYFKMGEIESASSQETRQLFWNLEKQPLTGFSPAIL